MNTIGSFDFKSEKLNNQILDDNKLNLPKINKSPLQRSFGTRKLHKEAQRFIKEKISNTGHDISGSIKEFIQHDLIHPLNRTRLHNFKATNNNDSFNPFLSTESSPSRIKKIPFISEENKHSYRTTFLKTDHIALRLDPSHYKIRDKSVTNFLEMKGKFNVQSESEGKSLSIDGKTFSNTSSVKYNIITHQKDNHAPKINDNIRNNIRKTLTEINEKGSTYHHKRNFKFDKVLEDLPKTFYKYNGIFSNIYDSAFRNGNLILPFKKADEKEIIQRKVDYLKYLKTKKKEKSSSKEKNDRNTTKKNRK